MIAKKLRVVVDINVFISAYFFSKPDTPPRAILRAALAERFVILVTPDYLSDLVNAFRKEKFIDKLAQINQTAQSVADIIADLGERVTPSEVPPDAIRDKDDSIILACAVGGKADLIVSGDHDLTVLERYQNIPIVTPAQFLLRLNAISDESSDTLQDE